MTIIRESFYMPNFRRKLYDLRLYGRVAGFNLTR